MTTQKSGRYDPTLDPHDDRFNHWRVRALELEDLLLTVLDVTDISKTLRERIEKAVRS